MDKIQLSKSYSLGDAPKALYDALTLLLGERFVWPKLIHDDTDNAGSGRLQLHSGLYAKYKSDNSYVELKTDEYLTAFEKGDKRYILYDIQLKPSDYREGFDLKLFLRPYAEDDYAETNSSYFGSRFGGCEAFLRGINFVRRSDLNYNLSDKRILHGSSCQGPDVPLFFDGTPDRNRQSLLLAKLLFLSLGAFQISEVDELTMLEHDYIRQNRGIWDGAFAKAFSEEQENDSNFNGIPEKCRYFDADTKIVYDLDESITCGQLIRLFGCYTPPIDGDDTPRENPTPVVSVCRNNICRFVLLAEKEPKFSRFLTPLKLLYPGEGSQERMIYALERITVLHELGHHVFRSLSKKLSVKERETVANWFASLFLDSYGRALLCYLTTQQPPVYRGLIQIPGPTYTEKQYREYCKKVLGLISEVVK